MSLENLIYQNELLKMFLDIYIYIYIKFVICIMNCCWVVNLFICINNQFVTFMKKLIKKTSINKKTPFRKTFIYKK